MSVLASWNDGAAKQAIVEHDHETLHSLGKQGRANGFKTYIVSGGGVDFIRAVCERI